MVRKNESSEIEVLDIFDPLDYKHIINTVLMAFEQEKVRGMSSMEPFYGAGIYAIYYTGSYPAYSLMAEQNIENPGSFPIYIGKAEVANSRKGGLDISADYSLTRKLYERLSMHKETIQSAENLDICDFQFKVLALTPIWIPFAENILIARKRPVWNDILEGFGNKNPGIKRRSGKRPKWDTVHPGRFWSREMPLGGESVEDLCAKVENHLKKSVGMSPDYVAGELDIGVDYKKSL
ncbi:Eco29kI family restriction endonuclease [Rothia mucilaginosa]|uniref:Eco29kI family restriction endonuclease n=1 Tax=Rothia mucilaginosa TaxID=43675 RepID=UPI0028EF9C74|nr:Eco29kI family restriction endonuclease [Rothia mucilaginosa]